MRRLLERFGSVEAIFAADPAELAALAETGITILTWDDPDYPTSLHDLSDPPPVLFVRGTLLSRDEQAVAIVGSRRASDHGLAVARGLTVVSGLALGIDTAAHEGALEASEGRTLAVLGSGLRVIHPRQSRVLAERIVARGALLSELRPEAPPRGPYLMARDRIIAALSRAVIVVEAEEGGGSLDTAGGPTGWGAPFWPALAAPALRPSCARWRRSAGP